ncbi:MAG: type II CAAX endopeptidase family protein [Coprobacillus sp.]
MSKRLTHFTRKVPNQIKWMFVFVILPLYLYCGSIIFNAILKFIIITFSIQMDINSANAYLNLMTDFVLLIIVWFIMKDFLKEQFKDFSKNMKDNLIYGCLVGVGLIYAGSFIGGILTMLFGGTDSSQNQAMIEVITKTSPVVMVITTVLLAPILEEFVFRGILFGWAYEINPKFAHIISAFVFAMLHIILALLSGNIAEWVQIFSYFLMSIVLSYLYEKTNNIAVPILTHMINNLITMLIIITM